MLFGISSAQPGYLTDVPEGHYAYGAVYDLVKQGITGGYPDGTFRGNKLMTRSELAVFLQKFLRSSALAAGADEKLVAELRSETSLVSYARDKERRETQYSLTLEAVWQRGETPAQRGERAYYRARGAIEKNFDDTAGLKLELDTMDSGFAGASRDLVREMMAFEGKVVWDRSSLKVSSGPGEVLRAADPLFPAETNSYFRRPFTGAGYTLKIGRAELALEFLSRSADPTGRVITSEANAALTLNWPSFKLTVRPRLFYDQSGSRDARLELGGEYRPYGFLTAGLLVGWARAGEWPENSYYKGKVSLFDVLTLTVQRAGSQYRRQVNYNIFDIFDRALPDGAASSALEYEQAFAGDWFAAAAAEQTTPANLTTTSWRLGRRLGQSADWQLVFETYDEARVLGLKAGFGL